MRSSAATSRRRCGRNCGACLAMASVSIPKFASLCRSLVCELRNRRTLEPVSKSFEENNEAGKLDKAEEIAGVVLPANEDPALPLNPGEEALDEPASHVAA